MGGAADIDACGIIGAAIALHTQRAPGHAADAADSRGRVDPTQGPDKRRIGGGGCVHAPLVRRRDAAHRITDQGFECGGLQERVVRLVAGEEAAEPAAAGVLGEIEGRHIQILRLQ